MMHNEVLSQALMRERTRLGLTQEDVARRIGCESKTVGRWERGLTTPTPYYRQKLMKLYGKSAEELGLLDQIAHVHPAVSQPIIPAFWKEDWGEAPSIDSFCGREQALNKVVQWINQEHCRIISILGIGGIGKTAFATKVAWEVKKNFEYIFWRSLRQAPPFTSILEQFSVPLWTESLPNNQESLPNNQEEQLLLLITILREHRCLMLLDNIESVLQPGQRTGLYREGYEGYGRLFQRIGESEHHSCLLLTSREKPKELAGMEGLFPSPVRSMALGGLAQVDSQKLLREKALHGSDESWNALIHRYVGNALALKIVSEPIREVFGGDIAAFLAMNEIVIGELFDLLEQQFHRLSLLEQVIMYWLAIEGEAVPLNTIQEDIAHSIAKGRLLDACDSLLKRSMIESREKDRFTLQPMIMEYVTEKFVEEVSQEIETETVGLLGSHALMKAQAHDYVRENQIRFILAPLAERLLNNYGEADIAKKLQHILDRLHGTQPRKLSYAAGNILNLALHFHFDLHGYNFSSLRVRQAYLQGVDLPGINFASADLETSLFTETFTSTLCVAVSPNSKLLAVGTTTGEVLLRRADTLTPLFLYQGHADGVRSVAFSSDGTLLASGSEDQTIKVWDTITNNVLRTLSGHVNYVRSVAFSPDGTLLASGSEDGTIRLWDYRTGQCLRVLHEHRQAVRSVVFSPDGKMLASGSNDQTIRLWDSRTGQCLVILSGHTHYVHAVAFSPDGNLLASSSEDRTIRLWDSGTSQCLMVLEGHTNRIRTISFSSAGMVLASGSDDQTIRLWDTTTGQCLNAWHAHTNRIWSIVFFPNEKLLISASEDETVRCWETSSGRCLKKLHGYTNLIKGVAFHPGGQMVASGSEDQTVRLWRVTTGHCVKTLKGHENRVRTVAFSPTGTILASGSEDETIRLWDSQSGQCLRVLRGHRHLVRSVAFNASGTVLASGSFDQTIRLWEVSSGQCLSILEGQGGLIWSVAFNFDDTLLASGSEDSVVRLWDVSSGQCLQRLKGHTHRVWVVVFSPTKNLLLSSGDDQTIRLWNASSGEHLKTLEGHTSWVRTLAISPDGNLIASGSHDQTIRLWDTETGQCLNVLHGHSNSVWSLAFNHDGSILASGSDDGTTKLWDMQIGKCIMTLRSNRPYERMNITGVKGLTEVQKDSLKALGAIEDEGEETFK